MPQTKLYTTHIMRISGILATDSIRQPTIYPLLTDARGELRPDGTYSMRFSLYTVPIGGAPAWEEIHDITIGFGVFSVDLGSQVALPDSEEGPYWIAIHVAGETQPEKRHPFPFSHVDARSRLSALAV